MWKEFMLKTLCFPFLKGWGADSALVKFLCLIWVLYYHNLSSLCFSLFFYCSFIFYPFFPLPRVREESCLLAHKDNSKLAIYRNWELQNLESLLCMPEEMVQLCPELTHNMDWASIQKNKEAYRSSFLSRMQKKIVELLEEIWDANT